MFNRLKNLLAAKPAATAPAGAEPLLVNAYCTALTVPEPDFPHQLNARRDTTDPELAPHLNGFAGYVRGRGDGQMTQTRYHLLLHLGRVRHHLSLSFAHSELEAFARWAEQANAVAFLPDGSVRDAQGRVLIDAGGDGDEQAQVPYPQQAWERKARSDALLAARGIAVLPGLPPLVSEPELRLRGAAEAAGRAMALFIVALRAESLADGGAPIPVAELRERMAPGFDYLTPQEQAFLAEDAPPPEAVAQHGWRYEGLLVLEWALGLIDAMPFPAAICDVPLAARTLLDAAGPAWPRGARLRPAGEILDALDLHYRLHWAVRQARVQQTAAPAGVEGGVVYERHYALNWLVRFQDSEWDEVDTPT